MNIAVSITDRSKINTRWPLPVWSRWIDKEACERKIHKHFEDWDDEAVEIIEVSVNLLSCVQWLTEGMNIS